MVGVPFAGRGAPEAASVPPLLTPGDPSSRKMGVMAIRTLELGLIDLLDLLLSGAGEA
jgi:hypothetical protein